MAEHESQPQFGESEKVERVALDVYRLRTLFVNTYFIGTPSTWILVDAGVPGSAGHIARAAESCFGEGARPEAIVLTHGHFDHVGAIQKLVERWDVDVYAHSGEMPYLKGETSYPPPDPRVGEGAMSLISFLYPRGPIDLGDRVKILPDSGGVPHSSGWEWIHTPGHAPGHVSFFRDTDRCLVAGDAVVTVKQESLYAVATQKQELHGPPAYFTPDWRDAHRSVQRIADLKPSILATGHGKPMEGDDVQTKLRELADNFEELAVPSRGRYVH